MMKQAISKTQSILSLYELKCANAKRLCSAELKRLSAAEKKYEENDQSISALEVNLKQKQQQLINTGQLIQWQAYQGYSKAQLELKQQLESKKSKLEFQMTVSRQRVDKSIKALCKVRHKSEIIQALHTHQQRRLLTNINEQDDESATQLWQHAQYTVEV